MSRQVVHSSQLLVGGQLWLLVAWTRIVACIGAQLVLLQVRVEGVWRLLEMPLLPWAAIA